jgi:hypothetical protein
MVIQSGGEFVEAGNRFSTDRDEVVDGNVKDKRSLAQSLLRYSDSILAEIQRNPGREWKKGWKGQRRRSRTGRKKRRGQESLPAFCLACLKGWLCSVSFRRWSKR